MRLMDTEYLVVIEQGPRSWGASVPDLPGVYAVAETREELDTLIVGAVEMHVARLREDGQPVPEPRQTASSVKVAA